jgi:hypothetical protein
VPPDPSQEHLIASRNQSFRRRKAAGDSFDRKNTTLKSSSIYAIALDEEFER